MNLIIYNDVDKYGVEELVSLTNLLPNSTFLYNPTDINIINNLQKETYRYVWVISHFDGENMILKDGVLPLKTFFLILKNKEFLLLNGCNSFFGLSLVREYLPNTVVVSNYKNIDSRNAFIFCSLFARLVIQLDYKFRVAFNDATRSSDYGYVITANENSVMSSNDELTRALYELKTEIALFTQRVATIEARLQVLDNYRYVIIFNNILSLVVSMLALYYIIVK